MPIFTCLTGSNADLVREVCNLYVKKGETIADVTWGKGAFWKNCKQEVTGSDLIHPERPYNFGKLPYGDSQFDHVVFDPPYVHTPGKKFQNNATYQNSETHIREKTTKKYHDAVMQRYSIGMTEASRVASKFLWVKCQDEVCSGLQRWTHIEVYEIGRRLGLYARDLFVLQQAHNPTVQYKNQQHARKNHSYLWIFEWPDTKKQKTISRQLA